MAVSFDDLETGDTIEIKVVLVNYDDTPNRTTVLSCERKKGHGGRRPQRVSGRDRGTGPALIP